jgi:hypothetical protein
VVVAEQLGMERLAVAALAVAVLEEKMELQAEPLEMQIQVVEAAAELLTIPALQAAMAALALSSSKYLTT